MKLFLLISLVAISLFGRIVTLDEISKYPKSIAKDFYIWQFLEQETTTKEEAEKAFKQVYRVTPKLRQAYKKRGGIEQLLIPNCPIYSIDDILQRDDISDECVKNNLTPKRISLLDGDQMASIIKKYKNREDRYVSLITMAFYYSQNIEKTLYANPEIYLDIFLKGDTKIRSDAKFNKELNPLFLQKLIKYRYKFEKFVANVIAYGDMYQPIKNSLLKLKPSKQMTTKTLFYLAFELVQSGKEKEALSFFKFIQKYGYYQVERDRANFWLYLLTEDSKYLKFLLNSWDINIYTIYAREELGKPVATNILYEDGFHNYNPIFTPQIDPSNPFDWLKVQKEIAKFQKKKEYQRLLEFAHFFRNKRHIGIYFYILERGYKFRKQSYPTPYREKLKSLSIEDQALIYALARQESRFIPSVISKSYALGMMQIMPFLVKDIAKRRGEKIDLEDMFNPIKNLDYAIFHIRDLQKQFQSPLFIAYAYNGGQGFTRRMLQSGKFREGKYEPFLSIETISYSESRKYGKKVLANYVVYRKLLGKPVSLHQLLDEVVIKK